ncbi:MAG: methenyltetrahydromethanopterin cyclohydrolase [Planctomycetia bacterium]|nr:methenyltetrahydromethanopterin cyclohydrolase [Planctomycetia bacterium]
MPATTPLQLNRRAAELCDRLAAEAPALRIAVRDVAGSRVLDLGIAAPGGLEAGRRMAEICTAGLADVSIVPGPAALGGTPAVLVRTDQPVAACMAAQYAGWQISRDEFFAMGSGPMRALAGKEELFGKIGFQEQSDAAVGVLETRKLPSEAVCRYVAEACHVAADRLTLLVAPTASQAGTVQIVARSVETALHKLLELGFDLSRVESGCGVAPLPPVAKDDVSAIGRTNDAVLYGAAVTLWVRGDDASLDDIVRRVPSNASKDYGSPFAELFRRHGGDFYKIDPMLFSPAVVSLVNLDSGRTFQAGEMALDVLRRSFFD